jgi:hypothetical protein
MDAYQPRHGERREPEPVEVCPLCEDHPGFWCVEDGTACPLCYGKGWLPSSP